MKKIQGKVKNQSELYVPTLCQSTYVQFKISACWELALTFQRWLNAQDTQQKPRVPQHIWAPQVLRTEPHGLCVTFGFGYSNNVHYTCISSQ